MVSLVFDPTEFISLILASIGLLAILYLYFLKNVKKDCGFGETKC